MNDRTLSWDAASAPPTDANSVAFLEAIYDAHHRQAMGLACRILGNASEAEEVVQEAFLAAWRAAHQYDREKRPPRAWLLAIVRHRAIDLVRGRRSQPLDASLLVAPGLDLADDVTRHLDAELARRALDALPPEQREVIELAYFDGLSQTEIAARLAVPLGTVKGRIRLGLGRLRQVLVSQSDVTPGTSLRQKSAGAHRVEPAWVVVAGR